MQTRMIVTLLAATVMVGAGAPAQAARKVAVLPLKAGMKVAPELAELVTDALATAVGRRSGLQTVTYQDVENALAFERKRAEVAVEVARRTGEEVCTDSSCFGEIAGALGVTLSISGTLSRLGESYVLSAQLYDHRRAVALARFHQTVKASSDEAVLDLVDAAATELFPSTRERSPEPAAPVERAIGKPDAAPEAEEPADPLDREFAALERKFEAFKAIRFDRVDQLRTNLKRRLALLEEVEAGWRLLSTSASDSHRAELAVAVVVRTGDAYADFAEAFLASAIPPGLDAEQLEMYRAEIENMAFPLQEKAREAWELAVKMADELGIRSEFVARARAGLAR